MCIKRDCGFLFYSTDFYCKITLKCDLIIFWEPKQTMDSERYLDPPKRFEDLILHIWKHALAFSRKRPHRAFSALLVQVWKCSVRSEFLFPISFLVLIVRNICYWVWALNIARDSWSIECIAPTHSDHGKNTLHFRVTWIHVKIMIPVIPTQPTCAVTALVLCLTDCRFTSVLREWRRTNASILSVQFCFVLFNQLTARALWSHGPPNHSFVRHHDNALWFLKVTRHFVNSNCPNNF